MKRAVERLAQLARRTDAQDLLEYGLLAALIALVAIAGITSVGQTIYTVFWRDIGSTV